MSANNQGLPDPPHRGNEHSVIRAEDESVHSQVGAVNSYSDWTVSVARENLL